MHILILILTIIVNADPNIHQNDALTKANDAINYLQAHTTGEGSENTLIDFEEFAFCDDGVESGDTSTFRKTDCTGKTQRRLNIFDDNLYGQSVNRFKREADRNFFRTAEDRLRAVDDRLRPPSPPRLAREALQDRANPVLNGFGEVVHDTRDKLGDIAKNVIDNARIAALAGRDVLASAVDRTLLLGRQGDTRNRGGGISFRNLSRAHRRLF